MLQKLRTITHYTEDLPSAKAWYTTFLGQEPYFDESYYVGFDVNGCELALHPDKDAYSSGMGSATTYWHVANCQNVLDAALAMGATMHQEVTEVGGGIVTAIFRDPFLNYIGLITIPNE